MPLVRRVLADQVRFALTQASMDSRTVSVTLCWGTKPSQVAGLVHENATDWALTSRLGSRTPFTTSPLASTVRRSVRSAPLWPRMRLRAVLRYCYGRLVDASPEGYIGCSSVAFADHGEVINEATATFLRNDMTEIPDLIRDGRTHGS